jgi:hypothetical protein
MRLLERHFIFYYIHFSCLKGKYPEVLHVFHRDVELYLDSATALHSRHFSSLVFSEQVRRTHIFSVLAVDPSKNFGDKGARDWLE